MTILPPLLAVEFTTPLGPMIAECSATGIFSLHFPAMEGRPPLTALAYGKGVRWRFSQRPAFRPGSAHLLHLERLAAWLLAYFDGQPARELPPLDLAGCSAFRQTVMRQTATIPFGQTSTYGQLAREIERPGAARAVGGVMRSNRLVLLVPCHRVLGAPKRPGQRNLGGFSGGLDLKATLLAHEKEMVLHPELPFADNPL
jgi:AraC family transcriptional regulator of adaptative response/methylated-DNA-[protein]-cysteine methyltransferase